MEAISHSHAPSRRKRRSPVGAAWRGRIYLTVLWLLFIAQDVWIYQVTPDYAQRDFLAFEFPWVMATTSLLVGVACRQDWARYFVAVVLAARAAVACAFLLRQTDLIFSDGAFALRALSGPVLDVLIIGAVMGLRDIRRMVSRRFD